MTVESAQTNRSRTDQRTVVAESGRHDACTLRMIETTQIVDRCLRRLEEGGAESQRNAATDHRQLEIEQVAHRGDTSTHETARALDRFVGGLGGRTPGDGLDRWARRLGFEATPRTTGTTPAARFDDDVTDVARVATRTIEQFAVQNDAAADAGRHDHREEIVVAASGALPPFAESERLRIAVTEDGQAREVPQPLCERKVPPTRNVEWRDEFGIGRAWSGGTDSNRERHRSVLAARANQHLRHESAQIAEERFFRLRGVDSTPSTVDHRAIGGDETCGDLGPTDVDCHDHVHAEIFSSTVTTDWNPILRGEFEKPYWKELQGFVAAERRRTVVYPPHDQVFRALHETSFADTRVVILGQDPYHGAGQAHGLCFSVNRDVPIPPSLVNIMKELRSDLGVTPASHGCLESWARQGVLLLNTTLTVRANEAASHQGKGWETFTDRIITAVAAKQSHVVFILWGASARKKKSLIASTSEELRHTIIESAHPSPLSAHNGFFESRPFSRTNDALLAHGQVPIDWTIN